MPLSAMSAAQTFVYVRTYARWIDSLQRRETWDETVSRYFAFMKGKFADKVPKKVWAKTEDAVRTMGVMPSMRALWSAGPALEKNNILAYNCSCMVFKDLQSPVELFYILMCGAGVGFSVEKQFIKRMPTVARHTGEGLGIHVVGDSREGWATALKVGLETWFAGKDIEFDYSKVRPRGARLMTMGGRASGPDPLRKLLDFTRDMVMKAAGRQLTSLELLDLGNTIGEVVVVGGVRRSSEIVFSDLEDTAIRDAKDFSLGPVPPHRAMSNNSVCYHGRPDIITFMKEWASLAASGSGERGIFNLKAAMEASPRRAVDKLGKPWSELGKTLRTNPCWSPGTMIQTRTGHFPIESLVGKTVEIWNGDDWQEINNFRVTGENQPVLKVTFQDGSFERVTPYHIAILDGGARIEAQDLTPGMRVALSNAPLTHGDIKEPAAYAKGFMVGDGTLTRGNPLLFLYNTKYECADRILASVAELPVSNANTNSVTELGFCHENINRRVMQGLSLRKGLTLWCGEYKKRLPKDIFAWDLQSKLDFIAGVMDSDGTASDTKNGFLYQISSIHKDWLTDFQLLLKTIGVKSKLNLMKKGGATDFGPLRGGVYQTQDCWRLTVSQQSSIVLSQQVKFSRLQSFAHKATAYKLATRSSKVISVESDGIEPLVYCCTVEGNHALGLTSGFYWGQCGEINLLAESGGFCCLSEAVIRAEDTAASLAEKVKSAVWMGAMQACLVDFPFIRPSFKEACEEERLLGVSLTGQMDNPKLMSADRLHDLKEIAIRECRKACKALGINMSAAITTGKPSGSVSQLTNSSSGAHPRYAPFYIRRYRISSTDPLFKMMKDQGVPFSPENNQGPEYVEAEREAMIKLGRSREEANILVPDWNEDSVRTWVVEFPEAAPAKAIVRSDLSAIQQMEWYLKIKRMWCEHNQSITVYVKEDEWLKVGDWVYSHFDEISGLAFLPYDAGGYKQAPYEEITEVEYKRRVREFKKIDYSQLSRYEVEDNTTGAQQLACSGGKCEIS